ncbi:MAG: 1-phosphofructokinase family hexose kinase [Xanthobacteraceae bacterium]
MIVTITPNPAIDVSTPVEEVAPIRKLRCLAARRDPGGGGINVARVVQRLGGEVSAIYPAGGATGQLLHRLVEREGVRGLTIETLEETREDFTVLEGASGRQYRFILPGAPMCEDEWRACLQAVCEVGAAGFVVASGSLPPGVPDDFYARVARIAKEHGSKMVLDTSGQAFRAALQEGVYLAKPNLRELRELTQLPLADEDAWIMASRTLVDSEQAQVVALTLGHHGALITTAEETFRVSALDIRPTSTVGAGDSFLGAMVHGLAAGMSLADASRYGVAAGSAALLNPGTELCHAQDVQRLFAQVCIQARAR